MEFDLTHAIPVLQRTPAVLRQMLGGLEDSWLHSNYGPETFSPFDVIGHLIHGENTDWMPRVRHIQKHGESVPFPKFDRYAMYEKSRGKTIDDLLTEFATLREKNLADLKAMNFGEKDLALTGTHPILGRVTMRQLLATWVAHDLNHIHQIAKCMAIQYREACGPWVGNLGVFV